MVSLTRSLDSSLALFFIAIIIIMSDTLLKNLDANLSSGDFQKVPLNSELFNQLVQPHCFRRCATTDVDVVLMNEMECMYKCAITYKQAFSHLQSLE